MTDSSQHPSPWDWPTSKGVGIPSLFQSYFPRQSLQIHVGQEWSCRLWFLSSHTSALILPWLWEKGIKFPLGHLLCFVCKNSLSTFSDTWYSYLIILSLLSDTFLLVSGRCERIQQSSTMLTIFWHFYRQLKQWGKHIYLISQVGVIL